MLNSGITQMEGNCYIQNKASGMMRVIKWNPNT